MSRCSGDFWLWRWMEQVRYGSSLKTATDFYESALSTDPGNAMLQHLGRGAGSMGQRGGRVLELDLPLWCQESSEPKTTNVCLSLIYADEHVLISYPHPLSRLSAVHSMLG